MSWPAEFDSILVAPRYYQQFKTLPDRAPPDIASRFAGVELVADPYIPENAVALMLRGELVGWIELETT